MRIFDGKKEAQRILVQLKSRIKKEKLSPSLAVLLVGRNPESLIYIRNKKIAAKKVGIKVIISKFRKNIGEKKVIAKIKEFNNNSSIDGIIVQLPLPEKFDTSKIINAIDFKKDVDGFCQKNRELLKKSKPYFFPVLPWAIFTVLKHISGLEDKKIIALVNSDIFGKTIKVFFERKGIKIEYLLKNKNKFSKLKSADIIISVKGLPRFIKADMIKKNAALIDAGIRIVNGKIVGDVDKEGMQEKASFLTPVPGGLGPLTVALLLTNVYLASKRKNNSKIG